VFLKTSQRTISDVPHRSYPPPYRHCLFPLNPLTLCPLLNRALDGRLPSRFIPGSHGPFHSALFWCFQPLSMRAPGAPPLPSSNAPCYRLPLRNPPFMEFLFHADPSSMVQYSLSASNGLLPTKIRFRSTDRHPASLPSASVYLHPPRRQGLALFCLTFLAIHFRPFLRA